jgi:putative thiamine transport system permease protein
MEDRRTANHTEHMLFVPLMIPQVGFLFGLQIMLLWLKLDGTTLALIWAHLLFVLPYVWLSLAPAWRNFRIEWLHLAASLGASPVRRFFRVRLPILIQPIMTSFAVGFSVSAALYLPTVFAGNGRVVTLTVEAVTLASGASRSQLGVATGLQMALPLLVFILAGVVARRRTARFSYFS